MKKTLNLLWLALIFVSCAKPISTEELLHLNGYWEISEVQTADGDKKEFHSNNNVDFFELNDRQGTRLKVVPQLDGATRSNNIKEYFTVVDSANATYLKYKTDFAKWSEKIDKLNAEELIIINANDIKYTYKRFTPIKINE